MSSKGVAFVTGAASGIGRAVALRLADDGYDVALNDVKSSGGSLDGLAEEIIQKGRKASAHPGDVSMDTDVQNMINGTVRNLGGLDITVANAGIAVIKPLEDITVDDFDRVYGVNVRGIFLCYKFAAQQMIKQGRGGRIIGASSVTGKQGYALGSAYSTSKFAIRGLTQCVAKELGPHQITVNTYAPGAIETPMLRFVAEATGDSDAFDDFTKTQSAVGYHGTPAEIASIVSYLASKEAHFITGELIIRTPPNPGLLQMPSTL